ncbi:ring finger domain protein [Apiospora arundinis]
MAPSGLPLPLTSRRPVYGIYFEAEPRSARVGGIVVSVLANSACASFFLFRAAQVQSWRSLAWTTWLLLAIYFDSYLFVMASAVLHFGFSLNEFHSLCEAATLLCLLAYLSSKAYTVYGSGVSRYKSKTYLIHFAVLTVALFCCWIVLIIFRFSRVENGLCIIGIEQSAMIGPVAIDVACNVRVEPYRDSHPLYTMPSLKSVLFNAFVLFWVTRTDSRDITTSKSRSNKSGDDSGRSRVTRLSFYTSWIRANMGQGPHPGRPFIIPPQATPPLMGSGDGVVDVNDDNSKESEDATVTASSFKADERRASIMTGAAIATTTTAGSVAESSQGTKAPTKSILKSPPPSSPSSSPIPMGIINNDPAAARLDYESCTEIWTGPETGHPDPPGLDNGFAESLILGNSVAIYGETRAEMETEMAAATPMIMTKTANDHYVERS